MKLNEALAKAAAARALPVGHEVFLAVGFEPLHLPVLLEAHYAARFPGSKLRVATGVYGDLDGNLERAARSEAVAALVIVEWSDLDPRLGLRATGPWSGARQAEILVLVEERLGRLATALRETERRMPVVLAPPSVNFPLGGHTHGAQLSLFELELERLLLGFLAALARDTRTRIVHPARMAQSSPHPSRHDARSELATGFPFRIEHASALASTLLLLAFPHAPKKGLITDLDDTFWSGLVGEVGVEQVAWSQAERAQSHGLYQLMLRQLSESGVLIAVASKNDPTVVERALARSDLLLDKSALFPIAVSWGAKSAAVTGILEAWNISADAVVVVDDSRMELEEIRRQHPDITALEFSPKDPGKVLELLEQLRDLFGKPVIVEEDRLRAESLRGRAAFEAQRQGQDMAGFLRGLGGTVRFEPRESARDERLFSLINKTNQFNLNGRRLSEGEWQKLVSREGSFALGVSYTDIYGPLGTIAVMAGTTGPEGTVLEHWVLSCRAFSRRIEDHMLHYLLEQLGTGPLRLAYAPTERNQPLREFLERLGFPTAAPAALEVGRALLDTSLVELPHTVESAAAALESERQES